MSLGIDLDAARRESAYPDGIPVILGGQTFTLPAELPLDVFDPLLSDDFDLVGLIKEVVSTDAADYGTAISDLLTARPNLPVAFINTVYDCLRLLFGAEQFADFQAQRPGLPTYARLIRGLFQVYGATLGEAFASPASSESGGATSKETSNSTTESTPAPSGGAPELAPAS